MENMKLFLFRIILYLYTVTSILLGTGCSSHSPADGQINRGLSGFNSRILLSTNAQNLELRKERSVGFTDPIKSDHDSIFISDFRGDNKPEIAIISENKLLIYTIKGGLLLEKIFKQPHEPSFTYDADKDGKTDIILGTVSAPKNEIIIINGVGNIISKFKEDKSSQNFSSLTPVGIFQNRLFATARPAFPEASRGILCFDPFSMNLLYTFYTPDPIDISIIESNTPNPVMVPSYNTHNDGVFLKYAKETDRRIKEDYEREGALLKISLDGTPLAEYEILNRTDNILGTLNYRAIPDVNNEILLFHYLSGSKESFYHILKIDTGTGKIISQSLKQEGEYIDSVIIPLRNDFRIIASIKKNNYYNINQLSGSQELLHSISFNSRPELKQVLMNREKDDYLLLIIFPDGIYSLDRNMQLNKVIEGRNYIDLQIFDYNKQRYMVLLKNTEFEIYSIN